MENSENRSIDSDRLFDARLDTKNKSLWNRLLFFYRGSCDYFAEAVTGLLTGATDVQPATEHAFVILKSCRIFPIKLKNNL